MADWFETRFREPVDTGELDPAFVARMRALVVEEWQADAGATPAAGTDPDDPEGDLIMLETDRPTDPGPAKPRPRLPGRWLLVAAVVGVAAIAGALLVADDDDKDPVDASSSPSSTTPAPEDVERFCNAIKEAGFSTSQGQDHESVSGALQAAERAAPEEIRAEVTAMADESRAQAAAGPPPDGTLPSLPPDAYFQAAATVGDYMAGHCGYQVIDVTATDHAFAGIPADLQPGTALVRITNEGTEYHEVIVERLMLNETRSVEEILALPDGGGDLLDFQNGAFAPPGMRSWMVVDLMPGRRYVAVDYIPTGATTEAELQRLASDEAPHHADAGMVAEIQVSQP